MQTAQAVKGLQIEWQIGDMLCLPFRSDSQDIVIEKGALDVFLVDRGSPWDPAPAAAARIHTALFEIHRYLPANRVLSSVMMPCRRGQHQFLYADGAFDVSNDVAPF